MPLTPKSSRCPSIKAAALGPRRCRALIREAVARRVAVSLSVVPANVPALAFYLRLGFRVVAQSEPVIHLKHEGPQESAV